MFSDQNMGNGEYMHAPQMGQSMAQPVEWVNSKLMILSKATLFFNEPN